MNNSTPLSAAFGRRERNFVSSKVSSRDDQVRRLRKESRLSPLSSGLVDLQSVRKTARSHTRDQSRRKFSAPAPLVHGLSPPLFCIRCSGSPPPPLSFILTSFQPLSGPWDDPVKKEVMPAPPPQKACPSFFFPSFSCGFISPLLSVLSDYFEMTGVRALRARPFGVVWVGPRPPPHNERGGFFFLFPGLPLD